MKAPKIIIGSRGSDLALWQANFILKKLEEAGVIAEIKIIKTKGDKIQDLSFDKIEGKGFFTKELEDALLNNEIDLAVHSCKDLPTASPKGLSIVGYSYRENPADLLLINKEAVDEKQKFNLKKEAVVGTSSSRRKSQLLAFRGDCKIEDLRGNVPTRIQKLREKKYDAILLAAAGIERLNIDLTDVWVEELSPKEYIPAAAQGVLALQTRSNDKDLIAIVRNKINEPEVEDIVSIERELLALFDGGCQIPLGIFAEKFENEHEELIYCVRVAHSKTWDATPAYYYYESKKRENFSDRFMDKIKSIKPVSVFITRDVNEKGLFYKSLSAKGFTVQGRALIDIKKIPLRPTPPTEWIFFSSKNAVKYFFDQKPQLASDVRYAVVGKGTGDELKKYGKRAEFIGYSTDTRLTGKQFAALVGSRKVLFPQAKGSFKTIQKQFTKPGQAIDLIVYESIKRNEEEIPNADILVFTSPSNVEAFFEKHKIKENQKVIAMGDATANALKEHRVVINKKPATFDDIGLVQSVLGV
ncbi:MAG: hydroxymethylbilane synthase [Bacteroidetes bacterium]|nr:hydroxymethylbilane synthase [Bacteroidota bacterium]